MKFISAVLFTLATAAVAAPNPTYPTPGDLTVDQGKNKCGNAEIRCCNRDSHDIDFSKKENSGILTGTLSGLLNNKGAGNALGLFDQCSKLTANVNVIGGAVSDLVNSQCKNTAACCDASGDTSGLVAVSLPCIPVAAL